VLREQGTPVAKLGFADSRWTDAELIDQVLALPILIDRPIDVTARDVPP